MSQPEVLDDDQIVAQLAGTGWDLVDGQIEGRYRFDDFAQALAFVNRVGAVAEDMGHHPDIELGWGRAVVRVMTHSVGGVTRLDLALVQAVDSL